MLCEYAMRLQYIFTTKTSSSLGVKKSITCLVTGPESETAFNDIRKCLLNVPINDSLRTRGVVALPVSPFAAFSCSSSGLISFGLSSILTMVGFCVLGSVNNLVHERSVVGEHSDSGVVG